MGRYYSGDIEGKFWFGVQSSEIGESFGAIGQEVCNMDYSDTGEEEEVYNMEYVVHRKNLITAHKRMAELESELGEFKQKLNVFFNLRLFKNFFTKVRKVKYKLLRLFLFCQF